jgi:hypothetical protein
VFDLHQAKKEAKEILHPRPVKAEDKPSVEAMREVFEHAYSQVLELVPPGRYQAMVLTSLETAAMYATKAFTHPK